MGLSFAGWKKGGQNVLEAMTGVRTAKDVYQDAKNAQNSGGTWVDKWGKFNKDSTVSILRGGAGAFTGGASENVQWNKKPAASYPANAVSDAGGAAQQNIQQAVSQFDPTKAMFASPDAMRAAGGRMAAFFGSPQMTAEFNRGMAYTPNMVNTDPLMQQQALSMLQGQAMGTDPAIAQMAAAQRSNALADSLALAGASGSAAGMAAGVRGAQNQQLALNSQIAAQQAQQRLAAQQAFMGAATDVRGQEIQQAGMNQQAELQGQQLKNNLFMQYLQQGLGVEQARMQAEAQYAAAIQGGYNASMEARGKIFGGAMQAGGGALTALIGAMSDRREKKAIKKESMRGFLDALSAKSYEYKDTAKPGTAAGRRYGIMAQDLEKTPAGKSIVRETEHGKMVDVVQGFGLALAAMADLNKRLAKVEGAR